MPDENEIPNEATAAEFVPIEHGVVQVPYALVENGRVVNVVAIDPALDFTPESGTLVLIPEGVEVGIGFTYADGSFAPPSVAVPESISDRQFFQALALTQVITEAEALAAVKTGELPAPLSAMVGAIPDAAARFAAEMLLSGATVFNRKHPLTDAVAAAQGMTTAQVDDFFRLAATL